MSRVMIDSGVSWIGEIPSNWKVIKIKNAFTNSKQIVHENSRECTLLSLTKRGVKVKSKTDFKGKLPDTFDKYQYVRKDDIVMCLYDMDCSAVFSGISCTDGMISPSYKVIKTRSNCNAKYAAWFFEYISFERKFMHYSKNIRFTLNYDEFSALPFILPGIEEQIRISNFLDKKCKIIDEEIEKSKLFICALLNYEKDLISRAINGDFLDENNNKDSGNRWIKKVNKNARVVKLASICKYISDGVHQTPTYIESGIPFLSIKDISSGEISFEKCKYISYEEHLELSESTPVSKGDILFCRIGTIGKAVIVETDRDFDIFVSIGIIKVKNLVLNKFIKYTFYTNYYKNYIDFVKAGGDTHAAKYNLKDVRNSPIILYSIENQKEIVEFLDMKLEQIRELVEGRKNIIKKLEEYKKSLIYEAVTGKIEV